MATASFGSPPAGEPSPKGSSLSPRNPDLLPGDEVRQPTRESWCSCFEQLESLACNAEACP